MTLFALFDHIEQMLVLDFELPYFCVEFDDFLFEFFGFVDVFYFFVTSIVAFDHIDDLFEFLYGLLF